MEAKLNIALISTERRWQGGEEQAWQLARGLRQREHHCLIVAGRATPFAREMARHGFAVHELSGKLPWPWRLLGLRLELRGRHIEVVHCNDAHAVTIGGLSAWRLPGAVVIGARRAGFALRSPGRYQHLCDRLFCVSSHVARQCVTAGIPAEQVRVIHDGVDPERIEAGDRRRGRATLGLDDQQVLLLSVGSLFPRKGHRALLEAMPGVLAQYPQARLVIAGDGDQRAALETHISRLGLDGRVDLLGHRTDVPDLIHACDLFVFPSLEEGFGSTLIDVMLARRPIVTTNAGGIPDAVGSAEPGCGQFAWIVPPDEPTALARGIIAALRSPEIQREQTRRARQRALDHFTADAMVDATVREYHAARRERLSGRHT